MREHVFFLLTFSLSDFELSSLMMIIVAVMMMMMMTMMLLMQLGFYLTKSADINDGHKKYSI
jgi:hypothetical protein